MTRLTPIDSTHDAQEEDVIAEETEAMIFDAARPGEKVPDGFDSVKILLNGKVTSDLAWKDEMKAAERYLEKGYRLFWEIDLGFFSSLAAPIGNNTQFLSLCLSLDHFRDSCWRQYGKKSIGLCLYRGSLDFSQGYPWDDEQTQNMQDWLRRLYPDKTQASEEIGLTLSDYSLATPSHLGRTKRGKELVRLFCRNAVSDYLVHLADHLPDEIPSYALFDAAQLTDPYEISQLLNKEVFSTIRLGVKGALANGIHLLGGELGWDSDRLILGALARELQEKSQALEAPLGVCLPRSNMLTLSASERLKETMLSLSSKQEPFRVIAEGKVLTSWGGLEQLIVDSRFVDRQLFRVLEGFAAAGGTVYTLGEPLGIFGENRYLQ